MILTDASRIATALMTSGLERIYKVKIKGAITEAMEAAMENGLNLEDATVGGHSESEVVGMNFAPFYADRILKNKHDYSVLKIAIGEGQNREIRRFFGHFGTDVADLKRLSFGGIELNNLPTGKTRYLSRSEYNMLRKFLKEEEKNS